MADGFDFWVLLIVAIGIAALFILFIVTILFIYQRKTFEHRQKTNAFEQNLRQEVLKTQIEVQDQTLTHISREIHDNITQVLSFIKLSLGVTGNDPAVNQAKINESRELLGQAINDLRDLSKSMSFDTIKAIGLAETIAFEVERINKSGLVNATFVTDGEVYELDQQLELVLFRIFQESVNNALKHANATEIKIVLLYSPKVFNLTIADNGAGFNTGILNTHQGSGLRNLQNRGSLIGASVLIESSPGAGCRINIELDLAAHYIYDESNLSDSLS